MSSDLILMLENVSKEYPCSSTRREMFCNLLFPYRFKNRRYTAVHPLSLQVRRGECLGIMGVNGSGKSTLLQMIAGTVHPTSGQIWADGKIASLLELGSWINATETGRENIYTAGCIRGLTKKQIDEQLAEIIEFSEIGEFIDQPVSTYSTGMVMRLAFSACIKLETDILLLDEVFAVGDARFAQKCIAFLRGYIRSRTVLLVSHDVNIITMLCSRAILMDHGHLIADGSPRVISERYLELCYGEKQNVEVHGTETADIPEDCRPGQELILQPFNTDGRAFGEGGAVIESVEFLAGDGAPLQTVRGGESVRLAIRARALRPLTLPAIGFIVHAPDGQNLFGDTGAPDSIPQLSEGGVMETVFNFVLPRLANGNYSIGIAVSTGKLDEHRIQIWNHNALQFQVQSGLPLQGVLIGLPMRSITIRECK